MKGWAFTAYLDQIVFNTESLEGLISPRSRFFRAVRVRAYQHSIIILAIVFNKLR